MKLRTLLKLISFNEIRNLVLGITIVTSGLFLAIITLLAHRSGNFELAGITSIISLGFVLLILIFVVPPLARSASAEATQLDLPFEFTTGGAIYIGLLIIVGFAAWNTGNNLLFIVLAFLTSTFIVSFWIGNFCLRKLEVKIRFPESIFAEEPSPLIVTLNNKKRIFPAFSITTEIRGKEKEKIVISNEIKKVIPEFIAKKIFSPPLLKHTLDYFYYLPRFTVVENKTEHIFPNRGRFIIKDFELSTTFPFGFFRHRRRLTAQNAEIIIFPKINPVEVDILNLPFQTGKRVLPRKGSGQDLLVLREYQPQDDLRFVDWKATAKTQKMMVREYSSEDERKVTIIFDPRVYEDAEMKIEYLRMKIKESQNGKKLTIESQKFEEGIVRAASLLAFYFNEQTETRLIIGSEIGDFGVGKNYFKQCLRRLALVEPLVFDEQENLKFTKVFDEVFSTIPNTYTFIISSVNEQNYPKEISQKAKFLEF